MGRRTAILIGLCAALAALVVAPQAFAGKVPERGHSAPIDDAKDCLQATPAQRSVYGVDGRDEVVLDVHFVLDGPHSEWGEAMAKFAAEPFADVGVVIDPTFEEVWFDPTGELEDGTPTIDPEELMQATRQHLGGYRPHGTDVVYTFTTKELVSSGALGGSVAGQADCIGGVQYPDAAFAVGEVGLQDERGWNKYGGKIAAHEVAHLMGAHHHYANCAEADEEGRREDLTVCTLMFNDVFLISLRMSTINGAIVRGHALEYANDTPQGPPPVATREVTLIRAGRRVEGEVTSTKEACANLVEVVVQERRGKTWESVHTTSTDAYGWFRYRPAAAARLRAVASPIQRFEGKSWWECPEAASASVDF